MGAWTTPRDDATRYSGRSREFLSSGFFRSNMPPAKGKPRIPTARQAALSRAALLDHYHHNELVMPLRYTRVTLWVSTMTDVEKRWLKSATFLLFDSQRGAGSRVSEPALKL